MRSSMEQLIRWLSALASVLLFTVACSQEGGNGSPGLQPSQIPTIGVANYGAHPILDVIVEAFKARLKERGYEEGKSIQIIWKSIEGDVNLASAVAQSFLNSKVRLIVPITTPVSQAVYKVGKGKIPIVFSGVTDPVGAGLVSSWGNTPGSGITGTSDRWPYAEQLDLIKSILPTATRVGFPYNPGEANSQYALSQVIPLAQARGMTITPTAVTSTGEVRKAIESLVARGVDAIYVSSDNTVMAGFEAVLKVAQERKVPVVVGESANVERGGLATYSVDYRKLGSATADLVIQVLNGQEPGMIPVVTFQGEEFYVNLDAARKMGVKLDPALLNKAKKVFGGMTGTGT